MKRFHRWGKIAAKNLEEKIYGESVSKFGGSSLSTYENIKKAIEIILEEEQEKIINREILRTHIGKDYDKYIIRRSYVTVSAPGKDPEKKYEEKVTDILITLSKTKNENKRKEIIGELVDRYLDIYEPFGIEKKEIDILIRGTLEERLKQKLPKKAFVDSIKAFGEEANAKLIVKAGNLSANKKWVYLNPKDYIVVSDNFGDAKVLEETYERLSKLKADNDTVFVLPGFYGYTKEGDIATFKRGGSDLTGAVLAKVVKAIIYENWTDSPVRATNPKLNITEKPQKINKITYKEMGDLAFGGFSIIFWSAVEMVGDNGILTHVRNTFEYPEEGTYIVKKRSVPKKENPILGIAYDGIYSFKIERPGLNNETGVVRKVLEIIEDKYKINIEFFPGAINEQSFTFRIENEEENDLSAYTIRKIKNEMKEAIGTNTKVRCKKLGAIVLAGQGMKKRQEIGYDVGKLLSQKGIKTNFFIKNEDGDSYIIGLTKRKDCHKAGNIIYYDYIKTCWR